jgi:cell wall-associated NlpC family hydrolase
MLAAMRMIPPVLVLALAALCTLNAQATPATTSDEIDRLLAERGLLNKMDYVRQNVSHKASELVVNAMSLLGVPYKWGGTDADTGFDCSGFVVSVYQQSIGLLLPRKAEQQAAATEKISQAELQPGDLVFFNTMRRAFSHVGIYVGNGKFIHAPRAGAEVRVESMGGSYWQNRFNGARRVIGDAAESVNPMQSKPVKASIDDAAAIR